MGESACLYNYEFWLSLCKIVRSSVFCYYPYNHAFSNIMVISWQLFLANKVGVPEESQKPMWILIQNVVSITVC